MSSYKKTLGCNYIIYTEFQILIQLSFYLNFHVMFEQFLCSKIKTANENENQTIINQFLYDIIYFTNFYRNK